MRFVHRNPQGVRHGDTRIKRNKFLWLPKTCDNPVKAYRKETRWLERASWIERYDYMEGWSNSDWLENDAR